MRRVVAREIFRQRADVVYNPARIVHPADKCSPI
jgi:hypothetical protein